MTDLLDLVAAAELRDQGMALAADAEPAAWTRAAQDCLDWLAGSGVAFTSDDVRASVGAPLHRNAMGALFKRAVESGRFERAGMVQSTRVLARGRWLAVYRAVARG